MENKLTGKSPQPIADETVTIEDNLPAQELCEQVQLLTAQAREALLQQALTVSNEKCNGLILKLIAQVEELTQQVSNVKWNNKGLVKNLKEDIENMLKELKESNNNLSEVLRKLIRLMTEIATQIQEEVSTATAKATNEATALFNKKINEAADSAIAKMDKQAEEISKKVKAAEKEIDGVKDDIHYERGFRKFMFWATPVLLLVQTVITAFLLLK